jgi:ABC-type bacteriocin/lantibiotic exporter with double-glycine peptidase domain
MKGKNKDGIFLSIRPYQEELFASRCGPASLKMVLGFYGLEKSEEELAELCQTDPDLGTSAEQIQQAAQQLGFQAEVKHESSLEEIEKYLKKGIPPIVNWFTSGRADYGESAVPDGHYSPVAGLDEQCIYLQDPEIGKIRKLEREDFLTVWFDFEGKFISREELLIRSMLVI